MTALRYRALALDAADPLAPLRERFEPAEPGLVYLDGNSLGRPPCAVAARVRELEAEWAGELVSGWERWMDAPARAGAAIAPLIGAGAHEVLACDSVTVNLFKLAHAVLDLREGAILVPAHEFPTDRYVLEGVAAQRGRDLRPLPADPIEGVGVDDVAAACAAGDVALVVLSLVSYRSGARADLAGITAAARAAGARVIWDLSHAAGAVVAGLGAGGAELAVGCTYKYLCAGPGAPGYLYVREDLQDLLRSPVQGWFGQDRQFEMERPYDPAPGIARFLAGTPSIPGLAAVEAAAGFAGEAGIEALAAKGRSLTGLAIEVHDDLLAPLGFELGTPRDPARRGAHVSLRHPEGWRICRALIELERVIPDFRGPDSIRLGMSALASSHIEVHDALVRLAGLVAAGRHRGVDDAPRRVT